MKSSGIRFSLSLGFPYLCSGLFAPFHPAFLLSVSFYCFLSTSTWADEPAFRVDRGVRQLFLDDVGIERVDNLKRVVNSPRKHALNPVIKPDQPWESVCSVYGTAMFDEEAGVFKLWYLTSPKDRGARPLDVGNGRIRAPHTTLAAYAFSRDGIRWAKPVLDQFPYDGDTRNNLLNIGVNNCEGISVLFDQRDTDPARRWKCLYWDHGSGGFEMRDGKAFCKPGPDDGVCAAFSSDGLVWTPVPVNPVLRKYSDTNQNLLYDERIQKYVAFGRFGFGRKIARSESGDFVQWSEPQLVMECDEADGPKSQFYGAGVDIYEGVYIAMTWMYREGGDATIDTQLATSRDGIRWTRVGDRATWLPRGDEKSWEGGMVRSVERIIVNGDLLFIYYGGVHGPHGRPGHPPVERKHPGSIGLAMLRRDGFVSFDSGDASGTLLTKSFTMPEFASGEGKLLLNADASRGEVRAALCDEAGSPLAGFQESNPIRIDAYSHAVGWSPGADLSSVSGKKVRLRIDSQRAKLYGYWFE